MLILNSRTIGREHVGPAALLVSAAAIAMLAGCGKLQIGGMLLPNQPPTIRLTQVPVPADTTGTYAYELSWAGFDADGRVERFHYAIDPPSGAVAETTWVKTTANRRTFVFRSDSVAAGGVTHARAFHTIVVRCEDDRGALSAVASASFTSTTIAPVVQVTLPAPSRLLARAVPGSLRIEWQGEDPDGIPTTQPVSYRWKLFGGSSEFTPIEALADPDSLRRRYAPSFAEWDSVGGEVSAVSLRNLVAGQEYLFVVVAFDRAGAYSPVFTGDGNMLHFRVDASASLGPRISLSSPSFRYTFPSGGYYLDPAWHVKVEFPADQQIQLAWSATPAPGGFVRGYRWAVDLASVDDETPRSDEAQDLRHWSRFSSATEIVLPPFSPGPGAFSETHYFYLEAEDDLHLSSLAVLEFTVVRASFDRPLLIVDDTWFPPDRAGTGGCVQPPTGLWPTAAELDTFLYARGGRPYRCMPAGTLSPAGVFAGYSYDTLGTHFATSATLSLQRLDRYRHVIWITDPNSAFTYNELANTWVRPRPLLYEWSGVAVSNPLATWLLQGGRLWLMGGSAMASLRPFDQIGSFNNVFSSSLGELGPGRTMYDHAHWRSEIRVLRSFRAGRSTRAVGGWPGAPDYSRLPEALLEKTLLTDPFPPLRNGNFHHMSYVAEHLFKPNVVLESDQDPSGLVQTATLDTLYETQGGETGTGWPVMTLYHGSSGPLFVFSGFPIWYFQRSQVIELVDFVLGRVWGLGREPVPR